MRRGTEDGAQGVVEAQPEVPELVRVVGDPGQQRLRGDKAHQGDE
ncbi:hypothetical protein AB0K93_09580 [Streptomyces sp. NPDC052676]